MTVQQIVKVLDEGIDLNQYILMNMIALNEDLTKITKLVKIQGWITMMKMKRYLEEINGKLFLTEKGKNIVANVGKINIDLKIDTGKYKWENLHSCLRIELKRLTGKNQFQLEVKGREYPYLPGLLDLRSKIEKFIEKYEMNDMEKIERCLMRHLAIRNQKMIYYIIREKGDAKSDLAADYENFYDLKEIKIKGLGGTVSI